MPERQPRKTGLSPSPLPLVLFIVILAVVVVGTITLLMTGMTAPAPVQTGALARSDEAQPNLVTKQTAMAVETAKALDDETNYATRVLPVPTDAPLPPGFKTPTPLPPPTEITYTPGPTANLEVLAPTGEWKEYVNEKQGFTIKYPADWYLNTDPSGGWGTQIYSYDFNDPSLALDKNPPRNASKIEIGITAPQQFLPNESLREWVRRTGRLGEEDKLILEEELKVDGLPALRQIVDFEYGGLMEGVYVKYGDNVIIIGQRYREDRTVLNQIFDLVVQNFKIQK
jgi:hypothetical protein